MSFRLKLLLIPIVALLAVVFGLVQNLLLVRNGIRKIDSLTQESLVSLNRHRELHGLLLETRQAFSLAAADRSGNAVKAAEASRDRFVERADASEGIPADQVPSMRELKELYLNFFTVAHNAVSAPLRGRADEAVDGKAEFETVLSKSDAAVASMEKRALEDLRQIRANTKTMGSGLLWESLVFSVLLVILTSMITPRIVGPLRIAIDVADKVARGDLTVRVPNMEGSDEMANLLRVFRTMVENLRTLTEQIKEAVSALASASTEISASVTEIASGATETATAANETSTTVEEVRQTALDANRKAKYVSDSAQKAVQISQQGEKSVIATVEGIRRIESQMESIAESIMKLSEHGQAIGGIIATVEDVAEQSNLLAVNASIEAARAGEHGKGFAVVAHEVKSLAEQSKQSTSRVRSILDDIQKATSGAVMTTEQGSKAVEAGVKQSQEAGEAIQRLASGVGEAAQATTQIAVSSQEQLVGMDQVVAAMESIKQASAQNVTATKQVESAARDLQELGQRLKHLVEQYKL
jgi:methyl-accepting chemotaxis protein